MNQPGNGLAGVKPLDVPDDAIGVRYHQTILACEAPGGQQHILFSPRHLTTDGSYTLRAVELATFSMSPLRPKPGDNGCLPWPPPNVPRPALWARVGHNAAPWMSHPSVEATCGMRTLGAGCSSRWRYANHGVDGIAGLTSIEAVSQYPVLGKTFAITTQRTKTSYVVRSPRLGWGSRYTPTMSCTPYLPKETYCEWTTTVATKPWSDRIAMLLPSHSAMRLNPIEACSFFSEFLNGPGQVQIQITQPEVLREATGAWQPLTSWTYYFGDAGNNGYGPRLVPGGFEFSNDGGSYLAFGSQFTLSPTTGS